MLMLGPQMGGERKSRFAYFVYIFLLHVVTCKSASYFGANNVSRV